MARYTVSFRQTAAATNLLPSGALYATAAVAPKLREVHVYNTTTTACMIALVRLTTTGTVGAALTEVKFDPETAAAACTAVNTHTSTGPTITDEYVRADIGAAIGAGVMWTFDQEAIRIPAATTNGYGLIVPTGTGQVCDVVFIWDE
jgi:hypothetical protein